MTSAIENCERCETPLETGDLRCSICGQVSPADRPQAEKLTVQVLRCKGCGAATAYDIKHQAPSCTFCDSVVEVETLEDPLEQSEGYLPFTIGQDEARKAMRHWLSSLGWFRPSDLTTSARLEQLKPLWWVGWVFDAESLVSWAADSNAGSRRSAWAPHSGQVDMTFDDILVSASRGLSDTEFSAIGPGCDLASIRDQPEGAQNATIEQFELQRSQARQQIIGAIQNIAANRVEQQHVPGTSFRKTHVSVVLRKLITRRISLPAWVLAYRYKGRLYRMVISGQDASYVTGTAPYSVAKIICVVICVVATLLVFLAAAAAS
ncbi:MAG: hypothetical protein ACKVHE_05025 [Planctomycetales bacterium]